ncbi:anhydro-N-acetylmuramic acid kinase [Actinobacillus delphinicola]|uniref:YqcC family protein n=1 Tax=Actinobacillus delphinicola TaxID=51161 RepID=UPI002442C527|nr:YqcC family protein [Actinobacillus delphinicola]MDG6896782.1 anhydro-N-acetylmuramic acid kinase [Actinobacillus delphinicola]
MQQKIHAHLNELQNVLEKYELWSLVPPSADALASTEPFAIDKLDAHEWLQWIFIPRMRALLDGNLPLPTQIAISPYIEEALKDHDNLADLLAPLLAIEELLQKDK